MKVAIIGTGYVGLVAGACFAETGNEVICVDISTERIESLRRGVMPIYEPGLETLVVSNAVKGRLSFTTSTADAVAQCQVIFLAVPTPQDEDGSADLQHVLSAAAEVARAMNGYKVIVDKSTVPVGTAALVKKTIAEITNHPFDVVSNPEFLKEGAAVDDFLKPDRVVIGADNDRAADIMRDLYSPFVRTGNPIVMMRVESAELTKYAANSLLATKISFINEIARLCDLVGADVNEVRAGIGSDARIGKHFLFPGIGFGGSCFPKDLQAILHTSGKLDVELKVISAAVEANRVQKQYLPNKIISHFDGDVKGRKFGVWGIAFKANTDDIRESPAITLMQELLDAGAAVAAYDPQAGSNGARHFKGAISVKDDAYDALVGADALVVATEWNEFRHPDFDKVRSLLKAPLLFDGRNLYNPKKLRSEGWTYYGIGNT